MINGEKYRSQILEFIDKEKTMYFSFKNDNANMFDTCANTNCHYCDICPKDSTKEPCTIMRMKWLLSEYKEPIKLSKLEYDILKYLSDNTRHMYIARNENGALYVFDVEPVKNKVNNLWTGRGASWLGVFNKLFQFVQWEDSEPTAIQEVLSNCEVIKNESDK